MSYTLKNKLLHGRGDNIYNYINSYIDQHKIEKDIKRQIINSEFLQFVEDAYTNPNDGLLFYDKYYENIFEAIGEYYEGYWRKVIWLKNYNEKPKVNLRHLINREGQRAILNNKLLQQRGFML